MNSEECIVISDEEEETPNIVGTNSNEEPRDDNSNTIYMPEFVSVPSTLMPNMESEGGCVTALEKLASTGPSNFTEITKSDLKKSIRKNDLIIKIDGTLNPLNINAIMSVIKLYNFQNAGKFFFVKSLNPNEDINVNDLICHKTCSNVTTPNQANCIPQNSQKLNVICKTNKVKAVTVPNSKPRQVSTTTTTTRQNHERKKRKIDKIRKTSCQNSETVVRNVDDDHTNQNQISLKQNIQNMYNRIRVKPFDQIAIPSRQNVEAAPGHVDNGFHQNAEENCSSTRDEMGKTSHSISETALGHQNDTNELTQFHRNTQQDCYNIKLKPFQKISKPSHQVAETAVSTTANEQFSERTQNDSILQEAQQLQAENFHQESEQDPNMNLLKVSKNKCRSINWNNNTEWNNNEDSEYRQSPTNLNVFSVKTKNNSVLQNEPIQQNSINLGRSTSVSNCDKVRVKKAVKKPKSRMKNKLQSNYKKKYKLKELSIAVSRWEVENYFARKRLKEEANVNQIFIHDRNFESMTHYYCNEIPPNTQLYFVNKHNITTSLYMKNFPLFAKAIKSNKIKVISESTYKKYQPTAEDKFMSSSRSFVTTQKTRKFCKFVSDFHRSLGFKQNPFLKYIKLDHSYSVTMI